MGGLGRELRGERCFPPSPSAWEVKRTSAFLRICFNYKMTWPIETEGKLAWIRAFRHWALYSAFISFRCHGHKAGSSYFYWTDKETEIQKQVSKLTRNTGMPKGWGLNPRLSGSASWWGHGLWGQTACFRILTLLGCNCDLEGCHLSEPQFPICQKSGNETTT